MRSPGQDLADLISRLSVDRISELLGQDLVGTVVALGPTIGAPEALRKVLYDLFQLRPDDFLSSAEIRGLCYDAMTKDKLDELAARLFLDGRGRLRDFDPLADNATRSQFLGFFGIDVTMAGDHFVDPDTEDVEPDFGLFEHQRRAAERLWDTLGGGFGRLVLHMPTGAGKTRTAMHFVSRFLNHHESTVVIWLAASAELLDQAADAFQSAWSRLGNRKVSLVRFWGDHNPDVSAMEDGVVIAGLQKMYAWYARQPISLLRLGKSAKLVVVDEAHQAIAPTYRKVTETLADTGQHNALLGLTATPGRSWSDIAADEQLATFFRQRKVTLEVPDSTNPVSYLIQEEYLASPAFRQLEYEPSSGLQRTLRTFVNRGTDYSEEVLQALAESVERNVAVIAELRRLVDSGHRRVILFATSVRHSEVVAATLRTTGLDADVLTATTSLPARRRMITAFRADSSAPKILCNFGVLTAGFDAPNTSAVVVARPTRSLVLYSQMIGRAVRGRKAGGNAACEISTVVDTDLPGFRDMAEAFTNWEDVWNDDR